MTQGELQSYQGEVVSGIGHMSTRMAAGTVAMELYEKETNTSLVSGTLNVELEEEVNMPLHSRRLLRKDPKGETIIYLVPATINELECYIVRSQNAEEGRGRHSKRVIEIISAHKLRDELKLQDGYKVTVRF